MRKQCLFLLFILISVAAHAQTIQGSITDEETGKPIILADIINKNTGQVAHADTKGNYILFAKTGDVIIYNAIGYKPVQRTKPELEIANINVLMAVLSYEFEDFTFKRVDPLVQYKLDSTERAETYKLPLQRAHPNALGNPASAVADLFSKKSKEMYHFQKVFAETETAKFIDTRYTPEVVSQMTHLIGDSVGYFMYANPMSYDYARTASDLEIKMWIREKYKAWMKKD